MAPPRSRSHCSRNTGSSWSRWPWSSMVRSGPTRRCRPRSCWSASGPDPSPRPARPRARSRRPSSRRAGAADHVLVLTLSAEMSSTYSAAELAAQLEPDATRVVDTRTAAGGEGLVALAAARRALDGSRHRRGGGDRSDRHRARPPRGHPRRPGPPQPQRPGAESRPTCRQRPRPQAALRVPRRWGPCAGAGARCSCRSSPHRRALPRRPTARGSGAPASRGARGAGRRPRPELLDDVLAEEPDADWFVGSFGPVMIAHVGPGVLGLAWWWEPTDEGRQRPAG